MENEKKNLKASAFYRWFINNRGVTVLAGILLFLLNIFILSKISFVFRPVADFLTTISLPVVLAAVFYYLFNPIVDFFQKRKVPRLVSIIIIFLILAGLIAWGLIVAIPSMTEGIINFSNRVPHYVNQGQEQINQLLKNPRFEQFRPQIDKATDNIAGNLVDWSRSFSKTAFSSISDILSQTASIVISIIIFPFVLFYLLKDGDQLNGYVTRLLPNDWRADTSKILHEINSQLSNYVRGQVIVALSVAVMFSIGLPIIGLKYAIGLAIIAGFLNLIPFLGSFAAAIPMVVVGLATGGPWMVVKVLIVLVIEQTIEGRLISPLVLGKQLSIHPVMVLFVLLTSGKLFGLWGVLLGIPFYAAAKVIIIHVYEWYREISSLYRNDERQGQEPEVMKETESLEEGKEKA
ncbi:AI-2E family transporter [Lactococcus termiticola]|uniref:Membrane protein n=1 Tax=Lactococcus termiticola TaxID=2169526 RepID=A0A2R5HGR3_9LACT|nr:AI-2E family transporter [Lactococcus termiticola]GBG97204.1 membrane protein [Lactococcus termiticola]